MSEENRDLGGAMSDDLNIEYLGATEEEVEARLAARMEDPDWIEDMRRSHEDMLAGRVLPWRLAVLPLPRWLVWVLFHWIAPWTWGRSVRKMAVRTFSDRKEAE